jgi:hypothetical protein
MSWLNRFQSLRFRIKLGTGMAIASNQVLSSSLRIESANAAGQQPKVALGNRIPR